MTEPVMLAADRSIAVPTGAIVKTGYVPIEGVVLACRDQMSMGDLTLAYQKRLQLGDRQSWPPPRGHWSGDRFVIEDGRHEFVAALMLGQSHLLVAWVEDGPDQEGSA